MLLQKIKTTIAFTKNLLTTGAFTETSKRVEKGICKNIPTDRDVVIVEFGMGHGNITREILSRITSNSKVYAFEVNTDFCEHVKENIDDDRLVVINDGAETVKKYVSSGVDAIIASIPYTFFSEEMRQQIMQDSYDILSPGSVYSQVLYTKFHFKRFKAVFDHCERTIEPNIPPEYLYHCYKGQ
ncbi:MAG: methyltransferase domain-containing protein [Bacteroidota bacterium]